MKTLTLILFSILSINLHAQDTITIYYNQDWEVINTEKKAVFYRKLYEVSENTWQVRDYYIEGNIQMSGQYATKKTEVKKGEFIYYYKNGSVKSQGIFIADEEDGDWKYYDELGNLTRVTTFENGDALSSEVWKDGKIVKDVVYDFVSVNPEFPGGEVEMIAFIQKEFNYPEKSRERGEQGVVYIEFVVEKNGSIKEVKIVKGVSKLLDKECLRVVHAMPKWKPGEQDGVPVNVRYTMPISCKLGTKAKRFKNRN